MFLKIRNIFFITSFIFFSKWIIVFYLNGDIDFSNSLLFDLEDHQYFPIIHNLSNFNFYPIYDNQVEPLNPIVMPFYSIIYHSIIYKLFNIYGFVIIEFFLIFLFLYITTSIFNELGFKYIFSIFLALFIFILPNIVNVFFLRYQISKCDR